MAALADDPLARSPSSDAAYYLARAQGLQRAMAGGASDPLAAQTFHLPPLYPWLLALLPGIGSGDLTAALLLQATAGTLLLALTFVLARRRLSRAAALLAAALTLLYWPLSFYETRLLGDSLACLALVAALVLADALADATREAGTVPEPAPVRRGPRAALLGAVVAAAALLRPQALLLLPVLLAWIVRLPGRPWLPFVAAAALVLAPSVVHNARAGGDLVLVSDNGGVNLWLASTGPVTGTFATDDESFGDIARQADVARAIAEREAGHALSPGGVSSWFTRAALSAIASDPGRFAQRVLRRAAALVESFETDIASFPETGRALIAPLAPLALPFGVLLGLCAAGAALGARLRPAPRLPLLALACMVGLTALLFFHYSRFRLPLVPLLALGAAATWDRVRGGHVGLPRAAAALAALAGTVALSLLPAPHHAPALANGLTSTGTARLALAQPGDRAAAQAALDDARAALAEQPGFVRAQLLEARAALLLGQWQECRDALDAVERALPGHPAARLNRAFLLAVPDPRNPFHDRAAAASIAAELQPAAADDRTIADGLQDLQRVLAR